ncbi:MAG: precorrin-6A reductase [Synergistaceae bacterium]|jgi:cobalt-precorrin 5A hydrolase/precorrin-3B C17-methyltransferase|nr:precorrin-6A reductase [Synergistaceae bacterium]
MFEKKVYVLHYDGGAEVARKLAGALEARSVERVEISSGGTEETFSSRWDEAGAFVFVGALAIAVRSVARLMKDKTTDPALVVVSEDGGVALPVISGHVGGASDLARNCANALSAYGAVFVPTTSSDRSGFVAPDLWAARRNWRVLLRTGLASVIRKLVKTGKISIWIDPLLTEKGVNFPLPYGYDVIESQAEADVIISPRSVQKLAGAKPQIVPRVLSAGIGCRRGVPRESLERVLKIALSSSSQGPFLVDALRELRTAELKSNEDGLISLSECLALPLVFVPDDELRSQEGEFTPSAAERHVGLPGIAEQAASSAGELLGPRHAEEGVTVALSISKPSERGELFVTGTGPGDARFLTAEVRDAIKDCDVIVGYGLYVDLLPSSLLRGKIIERYGMGQEEDRVKSAVTFAWNGYRVALLSGGDSALFGLAPLALSMAPEGLSVRVLPGITAVQAAGRILGAPYSNGLALLSLSDYLQPWDAVARAMEGAAQSGLAVAIYNPVKRGLAEKLAEVRKIFYDRRLLLVRDAGRVDESVRELPISDLNEDSIDMRTLLFFLSPTTREFFTSAALGRKLWIEARGYDSELPVREHKGIGQFLVLGGTSEGRIVASKLIEEGYSVTVSVSREAGRTTIPDGAEALVGARGEEAWIRLLRGETTSELLGVIDATHPFALKATETIRDACTATGTPLCRFTREDSIPEGAILTDTPGGAAALAVELTEKGDVILLATGVNTLPHMLPALRSAERNVLARILPTAESMTTATKAGLEPREIIAIWGGGGADFNEALCADRGVRCLISKASGDAGGVLAKAAAAKELDIPIILISRPKEPEDMERFNSAGALLEWCGARFVVRE